MTVRAKFRVIGVIPNEDGSATINLIPVLGGSPENDEFYKMTPGGNISLSTINKAAADQFSDGQEFYVDFSNADALQKAVAGGMTVEDIARTAHELNRSYCECLGDMSQPSWEDAPEWQRSSAINGVNFHLQNPDASPSASHESWLKQKEEEGWKYGEVKNPETKEHPCFVPYDQLPVEQRAKDYIFRQTVHSLRKFLG